MMQKETKEPTPPSVSPPDTPPAEGMPPRVNITNGNMYNLRRGEPCRAYPIGPLLNTPCLSDTEYISKPEVEALLRVERAKAFEGATDWLKQVAHDSFIAGNGDAHAYTYAKEHFERLAEAARGKP